MKCDTVVIGSGASGMCSALALARRGQRVALVEQDVQLAPLLRRFSRDGWWCDPGLHYVGGMLPRGPLSVIFRYLGMDDLIRTVPLHPDAYDIIHRNGSDPLRLPIGARRVMETLIHHYPGSRRAITAYVEEVEAIHRETPFLSFDQPASALTGREYVRKESLTGFLARHDAEAGLQRMLSRYGYFLYGMEGDECPLQAHATVLGSFFFSAHSLARGGDEIVDAFAGRLAEHGVDIHCGCRAVRLELDHNRCVRGVVLESGDVIECEDCICTFHPQLLPDILPPDSIRQSFLTRVRSLENTPGLFAVFLAVDDPPDDFLRSNAYFMRADSEPCEQAPGLAVMACGQPSQEFGRKSLCIMRPNSIRPERLGEDKRHCRVTKWSRTEAYERLKKEEIKRTVEMFHDSFPGLRGKCHVLDAATPCTYESYTGTVGGSAYGLKRSTGLTTLSARTPLNGLHLAGQSVVAPGLLGVLTSSLLAVAGIVGFETVWNELRRCR